jgi:DNA-directed RNA polymerase subunit RPC12/RpoP
MSGREYVCGECRHHFGTPAGEATNARALMCPACGSIDLSIVPAERGRLVVMRAKEPAMAGDWWRERDSEAS